MLARGASPWNRAKDCRLFKAENRTTRASLDRIEAIDATLNSFVTITADLAFSQAKAAEAELARGEDRGPLHGIPIALAEKVCGLRDREETSVESLQTLAKQAGLFLTDEEVGELLKGVGRNGDFARSLRALVRPETEPTPIFHAQRTVS